MGHSASLGSGAKQHTTKSLLVVLHMDNSIFISLQNQYKQGIEIFHFAFVHKKEVFILHRGHKIVRYDGFFSVVCSI
jgi:hypothetical protein